MPDKNPSECVFCRILSGKSPGYIVDENDAAVSLLDINPLAQGHCLVIPRRHVQWWHDLAVPETEGLFRLARLGETQSLLDTQRRLSGGQS